MTTFHYSSTVPLPSILLILSSPSLLPTCSFFFFFNDPAPTEIYPLPLPDPLPISRRADAAARQELHVGKRVPQRLHQHQVHAAPTAYPGEVEHDDRPGARGDGPARDLERRPGEGGPPQGCATAQIERENDARRPDGSSNRREGVERWQGLESHDHARGAGRNELARPLGARDRRVHAH